MTPTLTTAEIHRSLHKLGSKEKALLQQRFFKTGPGEYGHGDRFAGVSVPELRKLARRYQELSVSKTALLLRSPLHEARLLALFLLIQAYNAGGAAQQAKIFTVYLQSTRFINNWDLVDSSAEHIIGAHLRGRSRALLYELAASRLLWERRIAIVATFHFIKRGDFGDTLRIAEMLLADGEDLMHKAAGWMLREVGKRDQAAEEAFLKAHYKNMPRTMLRYAIERFPEPLRQRYLRGTLEQV